MQIDSLPAVIDLDALLAPISDENPSGESVQYSGVYDEIREARRADLDLSQGSWQRELKTADWRKVVELATKTLVGQSKDLQVGAWLAEGLVKQHGFAGLRDGLKLMRGLHENFWATVFPEIDEGDDLEARANAMEFMDGKTSFAVKEVAVVNGASIGYFKWDESRNFDIPENIEELDFGDQERYRALAEQATQENRTTGEMWRKAKSATRRLFYEQASFTLEECQEEFAGLDRAMDECFGNQTPGLGRLKKSLEEVGDLVKKLLAEKRQAEPTEEELSGGAAGDGEVDGEAATEYETGNGAGGYVAGVAATSGAIRSRADALKRLSEVARFFQQTEPHSPVAHLVTRAVRWGNMPLESWLQDVIKDGVVLEQIRETLGLNTNSTESDNSDAYE